MPKFVNRLGFRYGRLVVTRLAGRTTTKKVLWECLCDCGTITQVVAGSLTTGNTASCGCLSRDKNTKHGGSGRRSYNSWRAMVRRCTNISDKDYPHYGGMGISIAPRWLEYTFFVSDMGEPPTQRHTLDRIDPYGDYTPENCRWATPQEQARNIRSFGKVRGVRLRGKRWYAEIGHERKKRYSNGFDTKEEAVRAREVLESTYWGYKS